MAINNVSRLSSTPILYCVCRLCAPVSGGGWHYMGFQFWKLEIGKWENEKLGHGSGLPFSLVIRTVTLALRGIRTRHSQLQIAKMDCPAEDHGILGSKKHCNFSQPKVMQAISLFGQCLCFALPPKNLQSQLSLHTSIIEQYIYACKPCKRSRLCAAEIDEHERATMTTSYKQKKSSTLRRHVNDVYRSGRRGQYLCVLFRFHLDHGYPDTLVLGKVFVLPAMDAYWRLPIIVWDTKHCHPRAHSQSNKSKVGNDSDSE